MIKECEVHDLRQKLEAKEKIQFIDCREVVEWKDAHIAGVTLLPLSELESKFESVLKDKNTPIIIHCKSGKRSMSACMFLLSKGYTNLTNVKGGIIGWIQEGYPVVTE